MENKIALLSSDSNILKKGKTKTWKCQVKNKDNKTYSLFFTCEDASNPSVKHEGSGEKLYMYIDDSLNSEEALNSRFCLDMSCDKPQYYPKRALKKLMWQPVHYGAVDLSMMAPYGNVWTMGTYVKTKNLMIKKDGYLRIRLDQYKLIDGQDPHFTRDALVKTDIIDIDEGTYDYTPFEKTITVDKNTTACVVVTIEGENYSGKAYFEAPFVISDGGYNVLPDFDTSLCSMETFAWMGQNLSKREWPHIKAQLNGETFYDDEIFLHIHRFTPIELDIPKNLICEGENKLTITYLSEYHDTIPLSFDEAYLLENEVSNFTVLSCPVAVVCGEDLKVCVETTVDNVKIELESNDFTLVSDSVISQKGLHVILLKPINHINGMSFSIGTKDKLQSFVIERYIYKENDNVLSGSGDLIYINVADLSQTERYLKWYLKERIGNLLTIRQVYHWGGQRFVNPKVWELLTRILTEAGVSYVHLSDGRDIESLAENPPENMLKGQKFLGRQLHERDGQLVYWREDTCMPMEMEAPMEEFYDLVLRLSDERPDTIEGAYRKFNIGYKNGQYMYARDTECNSDMQEACDKVCMEIKLLSGDNFTRHTGPSVLYKYFYEQGFDFLGAETMDGSTEALLAFLRGASKAYGKNKYGVHHALQWATFPHDTKGHLRRYQTALLVSYLQGVTDINTEEGLWFQEGYFSYHNRISDICVNHKEIARNFYKYISTHSRTGRFHTKTAFVHGRLDGWNGFASTRIWGMPHMNTGTDGKSWEMLKVFYPLNRIEKDGMSIAGHISEGHNKPVGYFTGNPRGNVDVVPIEKDCLSDYSLLIFAGYNKAKKEDMDRILNAVSKGAAVILSWAHLSDTTLRSDIDNHEFSIIKHKIVDELANGTPSFVEKTIKQSKVKICENISDSAEVISYWGEIPLIYKVSIGKGKIVILNTLCYCGEECVCDEYKKLIETLHDEVMSKEKFKILCGEDVQHASYIQENGSIHCYLTPVDWYNESAQKRSAIIKMGENEYNIELEFSKITKVVYFENVAAWLDNADCEIISINADGITVQGYGKINLHIVGNCNKIIEIDFASESKKTIKM